MDWDAILPRLPWVEEMRACEQNPAWHAEGDVLTHTMMVVEALVADPAWRALDVTERGELFWAAVLHDIGKPSRQRAEADGDLSSPGHARRGEVMARTFLWRCGWEPAARERVCHLVRHHMAPPRFILKDDPSRELIAVAAEVPLATLAILSRADINGRIAPDLAEFHERLELGLVLAAEIGCDAGPYPFSSDHARVEFFRTPGRDPGWEAHDDSWAQATVLCGLPGAGKDRWVAEHAKGQQMVSLDDIRAERAYRGKPNGVIAAAARERARELLRARTPFVWNATNLSRQQRGRPVGLCLDYHASVRIVSVEAGVAQIVERNAARPGGGVPLEVIERMLARWEFPSPTEAHRVEFA
ncbi:AAA family ATPase [Miltoncostaea oceani]|uniref:AAA family ATPase n=1 Tax=Miltoncostaea oceani TaxID=2843216 RepID=UPI001C3D78C5|nr:AAA family ATPase [Miltoncostaea oceani]